MNMIASTLLLAVLLATISTKTAADIKVAQFGGCLNETRLAEGDAATEPAFHCHMESSHCTEDEVWLNPVQATNQGYGPCSCDEEYEENVYITGCYDLAASHQVVCAYNEDQCPQDWIILGGDIGRFNNDHTIADSCKDGASANGDATAGCGKRCTCNYHYSSQTKTVNVGSSVYGICYNAATDEKHCSVGPLNCGDGEEFFGPHSGIERFEIECNCDDTKVGACMDGTSGSFSHCAVLEDSCLDGQSFTTARQLSQAGGADCRLCHNTWDSVDTQAQVQTSNGVSQNAAASGSVQSQVILSVVGAVVVSVVVLV